jgi:hypothetical protein
MVSIAVPDRTGNYGPETSPSGGAGIIQMGFDELVKSGTIPAAALGDLVLRDGVDPVRVILPGVTPGNILRVGWRAGLTNAEPEATATFNATVAVNFSSPADAFPTNWFLVINSESGTLFTDQENPLTLTAFAAVAIPAGAVDATVELFYVSDGGVACNGTDLGGEPGSGLTLEAWEIDARNVPQPGPAALLAIGGP